MISFKKFSLSFKFIISIILVIILIIFVPITFSRYQTISSSNALVDIAFYIISSSMQTENLVMKEIGPDDNSYVYTFSVSNFKDNQRLETKAKYNIVIKTTTNIPFTYKLYKENGTKLEDISQGEKIEQDEDGMYFRTIETKEYEFGFTKDETDLYRLYITYPNDYDTYEYQNILENISITIDSKQVLKDD